MTKTFNALSTAVVFRKKEGIVYEVELRSQSRFRHHRRCPLVQRRRHGPGHIELFGKPGFVIHTEFNDANGLQKGNSVRYVGVHVGKVEKVTPSRNGVDVTMKIDKGTEIPRDSKIVITTDGLLGEKIVSISPGADRSHLLADGDYIDGKQGKTMDDMMDSASKLMGSADEMVKSLNAVIGDEKTRLPCAVPFKISMLLRAGPVRCSMPMRPMSKRLRLIWRR